MISTRRDPCRALRDAPLGDVSFWFILAHLAADCLVAAEHGMAKLNSSVDAGLGETGVLTYAQ